MAIPDRIKKAWNAFRRNDELAARSRASLNLGPEIYQPRNQQRSRGMPYSSESTIIASIFTRLAIDVGDIEFRHVIVDETERFLNNVDSTLNEALRFQPNIDQSAAQFRRNIAKTLFYDGVAVIVPVDATFDPSTNEVIDILTLRVGTVISWHPRHIKISLYNEATGKLEEILVEKEFVAIVENPFYDVMNQTNSTLNRLVKKLNLLDVVDEKTSSGRLDLIIQLPYVIKSAARRAEAEKRRSDIELQLKDSPYGIAYADGTEKITQLNRPVENNLLKQVEYLVGMLYEQLGLTEEVMNGTADEKTMLNYQHRTILPIVNAVAEALQRSFLGAGKYRNNERIAYFLNVFKFVPLSEIAEMADKLTRNEIATSNEIRGVIGLPPSTDPKADKLQNSNMPELGTGQQDTTVSVEPQRALPPASGGT